MTGRERIHFADWAPKGRIGPIAALASGALSRTSRYLERLGVAVKYKDSGWGDYAQGYGKLPRVNCCTRLLNAYAGNLWWRLRMYDSRNPSRAFFGPGYHDQDG